MSRTLSSNNSTESQQILVKDRFVVQIGYATPKRYCSQQQITWNSNTWVHMSMRLTLNMDGSGGMLVIEDDDFGFTTTAISEKFAGISCDIWAVYGTGTTPAVGDADYIFSGELGPGVLNSDVWTIPLVQPQAKYMPDIIINESSGFNHIPPDGTEISTPNGIIVLRRSE